MLTEQYVKESETEEENKEEVNKFNAALRPQTFDELIGNNELKEKLRIGIQAAKERDQSPDSCMLVGPPGLGKTTVAQIIANESECEFKSLNTPSIRSIPDLVEILVKLKHRTVLLLDELHELKYNLAEILQVAIEDFKVDIKLGNKEIIPMKLENFCLIGATTNPGKIPAPLRDRFGTIHYMNFYEPEELAQIVEANAYKLKLDVQEKGSCLNVANRSRGTPRIANRLLRRVRDFAQVNNGGIVTEDVVNQAMELENIDEGGVSKIDFRYLEVIYSVYAAGPVGLNAIAASMGEDVSTLAEYIEPFLIRKQYIARTQRGRLMTALGMQYYLDRMKRN